MTYAPGRKQLPVSGTVTRDGKPVEHATVTVPGQPGLQAGTDKDGKYTLDKVAYGPCQIEAMLATEAPTGATIDSIGQVSTDVDKPSQDAPEIKLRPPSEPFIRTISISGHCSCRVDRPWQAFSFRSPESVPETGELVGGEKALAPLFRVSLNALGRIVGSLHLFMSGSPTPYARNQSYRPVSRNRPISELCMKPRDVDTVNIRDAARSKCRQQVNVQDAIVFVTCPSLPLCSVFSRRHGDPFEAKLAQARLALGRQ
jgi:hypothetical protein